MAYCAPMKILPIAAAIAAVLVTAAAGAVEPEDQVGLERGKYGDPNALITVTFLFGKAELTPVSKGMLEEFAGQMDAGAQVEIGGHTDSVGAAAFNQALSERRAASVKQYLVNLGVNGEQLHAVGFGETQPIDTNKTVAGRRHNRRVVLKPQR
jgi:OOP family OmpA-OmpF porin